MAAVGEVFAARRNPLVQPVANLTPATLALPLAEVVVDGGPGKKIMRQPPPGATRLGKVEDAPTMQRRRVWADDP